MKRVAILGSTGSIGQSALEVIRQFPREFKVTALSANANIERLQAQINEFQPERVCVALEPALLKLRPKISSKTKIFCGTDGLSEIIKNKNIDIVLLAISGIAALSPLLCAIDSGLDIALANKEALVAAGPLIINRAKRKKVKIVPIDSEQSAIWQCLEHQSKSSLKNIYLTASGGPLRAVERRAFKKITLKQVLRHPRWKMGKKITVDSATLMNKGLEVLEAVYLFGASPSQIKVLIHPEAIIHSMVEFVDAVVLAQLSVTDMRIPIQYALAHPLRLVNSMPSIDFYKLRSLCFEKPDFRKFPCLELAYCAARAGGSAPCVLNAANEVSVREFLRGKLNFIAIPKVIEKVLGNHHNIIKPKLRDIKEADAWARRQAYNIIERLN